jgi:putative SbcD/Mre11-related phosphoesterase
MSEIEGPIPSLDCWQLTPEGAVIHPGEQTAVIADLHLGYEWARGAAGDCVPAHSLDETLAPLSRVLARSSLTRLVVAGDLVESARSCRRTTAEVARLRAWLENRGVGLLALEGNHDRPPHTRGRSSSSLGAIRLPATCTVGGWTIAHGHRPIVSARAISGHHHPVLRYEGNNAPCFLIGPGRIILPAFSSNAAGLDVVTAAMPLDWHSSPLRCIVSTGSELLDFGLLADLRRRLRRRARQRSVRS